MLHKYREGLITHSRELYKNHAAGLTVIEWERFILLLLNKLTG